jgi:hypothetical protein
VAGSHLQSQGRCKRTEIQDHIWKTNKSKKGWGSSLSDRPLAWQAWDPEFKFWYHQKHLKINRNHRAENILISNKTVFTLWMHLYKCLFPNVMHPLCSHSSSALPSSLSHLSIGHFPSHQERCRLGKDTALVSQKCIQISLWFNRQGPVSKTLGLTKPSFPQLEDELSC